MLLAGREREFLADYAFPSLSATPSAISDQDIDEITRTYARTDGFMGAAGLYRSMLTEADEIRELASAKLDMPVLAVGGGSGDFTANTIKQVAREVTTLTLNGIGHYAAIEAPDRLAKALVGFYLKVDSHR